MSEKNGCGCGQQADPEQTDVVKRSCCPPVSDKAAQGFQKARILAALIVLGGLAVLVYALIK